MPDDTVVKPPEKILGKYETPEARDTALKELHTKIHGEDAPFAMPAAEEDRNKLYKALEKTHGRLSTTTTTAPKPPATKELSPGAEGNDELKIGTGADDDVDVDGLISKAGLKPDEVRKQWEEHGKLTDEQYASLKKIGRGRKEVDSLARGMVADATLRLQMRQDILQAGVAVAGDREAFDNLNVWFESQHPDRVKTYNEMLAKTPAMFPEVVRMMKTAHAEALGSGKAKPLVTGGADANAPTIKTWPELAKLSDRAVKGDKEAIAQLSRITPEMKAKLKH